MLYLKGQTGLNLDDCERARGVNEKDELYFIDLEIDDQSFRLDKGDVWNLLCIAKSVFDRMIDPHQMLKTQENVDFSSMNNF